MIGDDRQRLGRRARQPPRILARAPQDMGEVRRSLKMPPAATLDQLDAMTGVALGKCGKRGLDIAVSGISGNILDA